MWQALFVASDLFGRIASFYSGRSVIFSRLGLARQARPNDHRGPGAASSVGIGALDRPDGVSDSCSLRDLHAVHE
jgi:hypothetical protein